MIHFNKQIEQDLAEYYQAHKENAIMRTHNSKSILPVMIIAIYVLIAVAVSTNIALTF